MNFIGRRRFAIVSILFLLVTGAAAQGSTQAGSATALSPSKLEAQLQALRQQLSASRNGEERYRIHQELVDALAKASRMNESRKQLDDMVEDAMVPNGRRSLAASALASDYARMYEFPRGQRAVSRAKRLARDTPAEELETLPREPSYAFLHAEAEMDRRANRHEVALTKTREHAELAWGNFNNPAFSDRRRQAAANELLNNLPQHVLLLVFNNRRDEAMSYVTAVRQRITTQSDLHPDPQQLAGVLHALAVALCSQDDYDAALDAINAAIEEHRKAGTLEHSVSLGNSRRLRLMIALVLGRMGEYVQDAPLIERGRAENAALAGSYSAAQAEALVFAARGQWTDAAVRLGRGLDQVLRNQGSESPFYKYQAQLHMLYRLRDASTRVSEGELQRFVANFASSDNDWVDSRFRGAYVEEGTFAAIIDYLVPPRGETATPSAAALAFRVAELLRTSSSQGALADGAARLAAAEPALRALVEQEQVLRFEQTTSRLAFAAVADRVERAVRQGVNDEIVLKRLAADAADKEKSFAASNAKLADLRRQIAARFPIYRELISPPIPTANTIGAKLRPGEVYVNLYAGNSSSYAFVVRPGGELTVQRIAAPRTDTRQMISALRAPFDSSRVPEVEGDPAGFDFAASHALYQTWISPIQQSLRGARTVYVSAGGVLSNLPWNVLLTQPASTLLEASWWVQQVTTVQIPGGSSLVQALGQRASKARQPFLAFAHPSFDGREAGKGTAPGARIVRQSAVASTAAPRSTTIDYRKVTPLPETLDEARAIAVSLGADAASVFYGEQASRSRVMKQSLSDARVIAFATHGLLPGQVTGMLKAGLAMAYEGRGLADSVLTIDDIIGLRLDADWVVLSACNTGYASGHAGDSMSALSRGFFASGARTLLATQWAVESESAKQLTVQTFNILAQDATLSKADALGRSQRDMIAGKAGTLYRHPYFWAPYFLAGDAAR